MPSQHLFIGQTVCIATISGRDLVKDKVWENAKYSTHLHKNIEYFNYMIMPEKI